MRYFKMLLVMSLTVFLLGTVAEGEEKQLFKTLEDKERFAKDISSLIEKAWKKWQDEVVINDIYVDGSQGVLSPGDMTGPVLTVSSILEGFDREGKSQDYIDCIRAVSGALENGMRLWQRGYAYNNIPFPRGASCVYTLPPCYNIPVIIANGSSAGDDVMTGEELYNYMLYRVPHYEEDILIVFRSAAGAISECFQVWKNSCYIEGILAEGGVAPQPAPMGPGPGLVKGAKGNGGKLSGAYFNGSLMYRGMMKYFSELSELS